MSDDALTSAGPTVLVVTASVRRERIGGAVGRWVAEALTRRGDVGVDAADLRSLALPLHDEPEHPRTGRYSTETAHKWSSRVAAADAVVFVLPEYNHSFSAPLKNAIDYLHGEWADKPVGLVSYGGLSGGTRAVTALHPVLVNLGMRIVPAGVELAWAYQQIVDGPPKSFAATDRQQASLDAILSVLVETMRNRTVRVGGAPE